MKVLIGTKNPGKIEGAKQAFEKYYENVEIEGVAVNSDVADQPINKETLKGVENRVYNLKEYAKNNNIEADFYIAIESGITNVLDKWLCINIAVIEDANGVYSIGTSQSFPIPDKYIEEIKNGELGKVLDRIFDEKELAKRKGGISLLTKGQVSRIELTTNAFVMALVTYINGDMWQ